MNVAVRRSAASRASSSSEYTVGVRPSAPAQSLLRRTLAKAWLMLAGVKGKAFIGALRVQSMPPMFARSTPERGNRQRCRLPCATMYKVVHTIYRGWDETRRFALRSTRGRLGGARAPGVGARGTQDTLRRIDADRCRTCRAR